MADKKPVPKKKVAKKKPAEEVTVEVDDILSVPEEDTPSADISTGFDDGLDIDIPDFTDDTEVVLGDVPDDDFAYDVAYNMAFVGLGQAGSRIASTFYKIGYRRVSVIDGPIQDLADVTRQFPDIPQLNLGTSGAGKDISFGEASVEGKEEQIWDLFTKSVGTKADYILICASLGGGTGSGAIVKVMEIAREYMEHIGRPPRVGCIIALPMTGEGQRFAKNCLTTFNKLMTLRPSPMIIIDNQRIQELFKVGVTQIYEKCNSQTARLFHLFNQLAAQRSQFITFDRSELASLLDKGLVVFGASPIKRFTSAADVAEEIRKQLERTALAQVDLKSGQEAGCIFVGSEPTLDQVPMDFFAGGFDMLNRLLGDNSVVHRGIYKGSSPDLRCFTMLAGLDPPIARLKELGAIAKVPVSKLASYLGVDDS